MNILKKDYATVPSGVSIGYLCIPKVDNLIQRDYIFKKICALKIGYIQKFVEIPLKHNPNFKRILFKVIWNNEVRTLAIRKRLGEGNPIYFVYNKPWFWKIVIQSVQPVSGYNSRDSRDVNPAHFGTGITYKSG
jgi:hypothetical protein